MALEAFNVEKLNRDGLRLEPIFQPILQIPFMNPTESPLPQKEMRREILRRAAQFAEREIVQVAGERLRQVLVDPAGARPQAAIGERQLPERRQRRRRRHILRELRLRRPAPAYVAEDGVLVGGAAVARRQRPPLLALLLRFRIDLHFFTC